jgi:hypothetical protein
MWTAAKQVGCQSGNIADRTTSGKVDTTTGKAGCPYCRQEETAVQELILNRHLDFHL